MLSETNGAKSVMKRLDEHNTTQLQTVAIRKHCRGTRTARFPGIISLVKVTQALSRTSPIEGQDFRIQRDSKTGSNTILWLSSGCRGIFSVTYTPDARTRSRGRFTFWSANVGSFQPGRTTTRTQNTPGFQGLAAIKMAWPGMVNLCSHCPVMYKLWHSFLLSFDFQSLILSQINLKKCTPVDDIDCTLREDHFITARAVQLDMPAIVGTLKDEKNNLLQPYKHRRDVFSGYHNDMFQKYWR